MSNAITPDPSLLDNPAYHSLVNGHRRLGEHVGRVWRYRAEVAGFAGMPDEPGTQDWADAASLFGPGGRIPLRDEEFEPPRGWLTETVGYGVQLVDAGIRAEPDEAATRLGPSDVPRMLDLVERTSPGPFRVRTIAMGRYHGIWDDGELVAMAGERLHPPGWREISAVCTDPRYRGRGLATRLVRTVAHGILARGEVPLLHARASNTNAIRLYESLGFEIRRTVPFRVAVVPH